MGAVGTFPTLLNPVVMRNQQLSTYPFRICFRIEKRNEKQNPEIFHQTKIPGYVTQSDYGTVKKTKRNPPLKSFRSFFVLNKHAQATCLDELGYTYFVKHKNK